MNELGIFIKNKRNEFGWSQRDLADVVGITKKYVSNIENFRRTPGIKLWDRIGKVFGVKYYNHIWTEFKTKHNSVAISD